MNEQSNSKNLIVGTVIILCLLGFLYLVLSLLVKNTSSLDPNVIAALIAGLVTVIGYFISRNIEKKKAIDQQIREKKLPVYEEFVDFLFKILSGPKLDISISDKELAEFFMTFNKKGIIWLSDESLKAYVAWREAAINHVSNNENNIKTLFIMEDLLFAFRKDIGHDNKDLKRGDLLKMFINDVEQYLN